MCEFANGASHTLDEKLDGFACGLHTAKIAAMLCEAARMATAAG
jgi:hypothetical protein